MVDKAYLLEKPPFPASWKRFLDLVLLPALIDAAGAAEAGIEQVAVRTRERPGAALGVAFGIGYGLGRVGRRRS